MLEFTLYQLLADEFLSFPTFKDKYNLSVAAQQ